MTATYPIEYDEWKELELAEAKKNANEGIKILARVQAKLEEKSDEVNYENI